MVSDMKKIRVASRRMRRDCATWPLSAAHMSTDLRRESRKRTEEDKDRREAGDNSRVSRFLHDEEHDGDGQTTEDGWQRTHANVRNVVICIAVADVLEHKVAIEADKPACQAEQELGERRMDIKVILTEDVVGGKLAKMDLVKTDG
jgi:hypothetical protein